MIECKKFIFDVDATLVDTQAVIDNIWKKWCETVGVSYVDMSQYIHGRKIEETLHCISPSYACDVQVEKVKSIALSEMTKAQEISNAHSFIANLSPNAWGIATSGPKKVATTSLLASGFDLPKVMICAEDVLKGKPDPEPFIKAAHALNVTPSECVAFEDSPSGVLSAKRAGCFTVALLTSHKEDELEDADLIVQGFEYLSVVKNRNDTYCLEIAIT